MLGPAPPQVNRHEDISLSDREFPGLTGLSGTQRARGKSRLSAWEVSIHPLCAELSASVSGQQGGGGARISVSYRLGPWPGRSPGSGRRGNWTPGACLGLR
jgi:hypothetical protein